MKHILNTKLTYKWRAVTTKQDDQLNGVLQLSATDTVQSRVRWSVAGLHLPFHFSDKEIKEPTLEEAVIFGNYNTVAANFNGKAERKIAQYVCLPEDKKNGFIRRINGGSGEYMDARYEIPVSESCMGKERVELVETVLGLITPDLPELAWRINTDQNGDSKKYEKRVNRTLATFPAYFKDAAKEAGEYFDSGKKKGILSGKQHAELYKSTVQGGASSSGKRR